MSHVLTHTIPIDFSQSADKIALTAQQGETGTRRIAFHFYDHGTPFSIDPNDPKYFYKIQLDKPDGTSIVKTTYDYKEPWSGFISKNPLRIYYFLDKNDCAASGVIHCKLSILYGNLELRTTTFKIRVEGGIKTEKELVSSSEYHRFEDFIQKADGFDQRIQTVEHFIADMTEITNTEIDQLFS